MLKSYKVLFASMACLVSTTVNAAIVYWEPVDGDVNYSYTVDAGFTAAMFDLGDFDTLKSNPLDLYPGADTIDIVDIGGGDYSATSAVTPTNTITLFDDAQFVIALTDGSNWYEPISWAESAPGSNIYNITYDNGEVLSIDAVPTVVPVPAAVWLFGSGLLGLVAVSRRKVR